MTKVKKWIESRKAKPESDEYEKTKRKFETAMGRPCIIIKVEILEGFEDVRTEFLRLEKDEQFHKEIEVLIKKRLISARQHRERVS